MIIAIISLLPILNVGLYRFLPATHHCTADWTYSPIYSGVVLSVGFLLPLIVTSICNFHIFRAAKSQARRVDVFSSSSGTRAIHGDRRRRPSQRWMWRPQRHRARAAKIILIVFGTFFCCWTTYVTVHIWNYTRFDPESKSIWYKMLSCAESISTDDPYACHRWPITVVTFVAFSNAVINPYVYTLLHRRMRKTLRKLVIRLFCRGRVDYRRSTILFAANFNGRGRSARQRMLNMKIFSMQSRESDLKSSDIAQQDSSSNREGQTSLEVPLDSTTPVEYPLSFVSLPSPQYENRDRHSLGSISRRNANDKSVPPGSTVYHLLRRSALPNSEPETEGDNNAVDSVPEWNVQDDSRWVGNKLYGRSRRLAPLSVTRWANGQFGVERQLSIDSTHKVKNRVSKKRQTVNAITEDTVARSFFSRLPKQESSQDARPRWKNKSACLRGVGTCPKTTQKRDRLVRTKFRSLESLTTASHLSSVRPHRKQRQQAALASPVTWKTKRSSRSPCTRRRSEVSTEMHSRSRSSRMKKKTVTATRDLK